MAPRGAVVDLHNGGKGLEVAAHMGCSLHMGSGYPEINNNYKL